MIRLGSLILINDEMMREDFGCDDGITKKDWAKRIRFRSLKSKWNLPIKKKSVSTKSTILRVGTR